jgi:hypothetical protein
MSNASHTQTAVSAMLARWNSGDDKPFKGTLIDWAAYEADPSSVSCMCAQGQVLHLVGGLTAQEVRGTDQRNADRQVAKLLNISRAHAALLRVVNDNADGAPSIVLTDPGKVLGDQWSKLLDFWHYMDGLEVKGWQKVVAARDATGAAAGNAAWAAAWDAARVATGNAAWDAAWDAAWNAAWDAARDAAGAAAWAAAWNAAWGAAGEIQGAAIFTAAKRPFALLPMFGFATSDDIPARPADYGVVA